MFKRLVFDSEMRKFIERTPCRISDVLLNGDGSLINEEGNFVKRESADIDTLSFLPKSKYSKAVDTDPFGLGVGRITIKIGRFIRKFLNESSLLAFSIGDREIEIFVNSFKSYFNSSTESIKVIEGEEILKWYVDENYYAPSGNQYGALWASCMRYRERNKYMKMYAKNPTIKMAVYLVDDKVRSRALLWEDVSDVNGNKYKVMDRIYTVFDHDVNIFKKWASENGYISKFYQNAKSENIFDVNGDPIKLDLTISLSEYKFRYYPYLDTFKYFDEYAGRFSNSRKFNFDYILIQSNGSVEPDPEPETTPEYDESDDHI